MEELLYQFETTANFSTDLMRENRKIFESMPQYVKAGLYYEKMFKEMRNQQVQQKYFACDLLKINGNQKFKNQDYESACKFYEQALSVFRYIKNKRENWRQEGLFDEDLEYIDENGKNDKEKKLVKGIKVLLYQNICLVYLKFSKKNNQYVIDAFQACNEAIKLDQKSSKAYYLRAKSRLQKESLNKDDFKLSLKDYKKALELDPENPNIQDEFQKCSNIYDKIKQQDCNQQPKQQKQSTKEERISAEPFSSKQIPNTNVQINETYKNIQKNQEIQINNSDKQERKNQQNKRDQNDQNRKKDKQYQCQNQCRIQKGFHDLNYDLQYELDQKTSN